MHFNNVLDGGQAGLLRFLPDALCLFYVITVVHAMIYFLTFFGT